MYESPSGSALDAPDNLTVTPRGGLLVCEDDASSAYVDTHPLAPGIEDVNRLIGLTRGGQAFEFAVNVLNGSEVAGACFGGSEVIGGAGMRGGGVSRTTTRREEKCSVS